MASVSKRLRVSSTKALVSGKEKVGAVSRVVDNNKIAVTVPVSVPRRKAAPDMGLSFSPACVCRQGQLLFQNYSNFKRSGEPARLMRYADGSWVDIETDVFEVVKAGFVKGVSLVEAEIGGSQCLFDLHRMIEINLDTGDFRSIAWIDVKGACFFPKSSFSCLNGENDSVDFDENSRDEECGCFVCPKLEIEIQITGHMQTAAEDVNDDKRKLNKRKRVNDDEGSSSKFQERGEDMEESEFVSPRWPKTRMLREQEKGYQIVRNLFAQGLAAVEPGASIAAIHRVRRGGFVEKAQREAFQKQVSMMREARGNPNVVLAWFGTTEKGVESFMSHGFGTPVKGAPWTGLYFSPARSPRMSAMMAQADENGEKHIILCRVILGKCEKIEAGAVDLSHSRVDFDTGVDDLKEPQWYGVFGPNLNSRVIPEFVLSYRPAKGSRDQVTEVCGFYVKLISKLRSTLPPTKVHELQTLYYLWKDGKLGKDGFMRELGSVIGDEVLRSTIQEIRG
ncbi:unnamed protein product [Cuscuta epithymum]|uniref:Poly [ADP-ribose] polymerase n=1 Tax=Cuscuta epithymum TaxID=186058 RepID=A0AAV0C5W9_9ASTE|nr:unnamed protein product [Cuscuta epithymum]